MAPGAWIRLRAADRVAYTVNATGDDCFDNEMYWRVNGTFSETITRLKEEIVDVEDLTKIYDAEAVNDPQVTLKSGRTNTDITYKYYSKMQRSKRSIL